MPYRKHVVTLFKALENGNLINDEMRKSISSMFKLVKVDKGELILKEGNLCNKLYFISKGLFRSFYIDENGNDITSSFSLENEFFTNVKGFVNGCLSNESMVALEDSYICAIERNDYFSILQKYPQLLLISHHTINKHRVELEDRIRILQNSTAKNKLDFFDQYYASIKNKVHKKHIASFLGMRYETLSRVKKYK